MVRRTVHWVKMRGTVQDTPVLVRFVFLVIKINVYNITLLFNTCVDV